MTKLAVLYGHPTDPEVFEQYYADVHTPIALKIPYLQRIELTKFHPNADGSNAPFYRLAELYFADPGTLVEALHSEGGKAAAEDLANFATGGATFISGDTVELLPSA